MFRSLEALEREHIRTTLIHTAHNQVAAAKLLGISRGVLARLIKKYDLDISSSHRGRPRTEDSTEIREE